MPSRSSDAGRQARTGKKPGRKHARRQTSSPDGIARECSCGTIGRASVSATAATRSEMGRLPAWGYRAHGFRNGEQIAASRAAII